MPEVSDVKSNYLSQENRSVNIKQTLDSQKKLEEGKLADVEIVDKAKSMGKDDFLKLLITQLTHQDPTQPVKDQAFIAQMAQFSSLEQMNNIATSMNNMSDRQSANLVGRFIVGKDFVTGEEVTGVAGALFFDQSGQSFLKVAGRTVRIQDVSLVGDPKYFKKEYGGHAEASAAESGVQDVRQKNPQLSKELNEPVQKNTESPTSNTEKKENTNNPVRQEQSLPPGYQETSHTGKQKAQLSLSA